MLLSSTASLILVSRSFSLSFSDGVKSGPLLVSCLLGPDGSFLLLGCSCSPSSVTASLLDNPLDLKSLLASCSLSESQDLLVEMKLCCLDISQVRNITLNVALGRLLEFNKLLVESGNLGIILCHSFDITLKLLVLLDSL